MAKHKPNAWRNSRKDFYDRMVSTSTRLKNAQTQYNVPDDILVNGAAYIQQIGDILNTPKEQMTTEMRKHLIALINEARHFYLGRVRNWVIGQYGEGLIALVEVHLLGYTIPNEGNAHKILPIPQEVCTLKASARHVDQLHCIVTRGDGIDAEEAHGGAWPNGVNGIIIAYRLNSQTDEDWKYEFTSKIHTTLIMPSEWRGKKIVVKAAYVAHPDDNAVDRYRKSLPWSSEQFVILPHAVSDKNIDNSESTE